jgi:hypothetical protein
VGGEKAFSEETVGDDVWVLPFGRALEVEGVRARMLDFLGVCERGAVVASRRDDVVPFAQPLGDALVVTLDPLRLEIFVVDAAFRFIGENLSASGGAPCGGVAGRDRNTGTDSGWISEDGGGTVIEMKVSTRRDLITFSSPLCELSGSVAEKDIEPAEVEGAVVEGVCTRKCELIEDAVEFVRGRLGLIVGAAPGVRLDEPEFVLGPPPEKLSFVPLFSLPLDSGLPITQPCISSPTVPSSDFLLLMVLNELAEIRLLLLRPMVRSRSSDR